MPVQMVFSCYEVKYMLTLRQRDALLKTMEPYMALDQFGRTTIRNIYYDTDSYLLVRRSNEKPVYKEKLRVRSYCRAEADSIVYVELKRKCQSVVYKRRAGLTERDAMSWLRGDGIRGEEGQIKSEIEYFRSCYQTLQPRVFLSGEREAYYDLDGGDFRLTLDENILARTDGLSLREEPGGEPLLQPGHVLLELKTSGAIPLWMTAFLTENRIYRCSFSKYGTAYNKIILAQQGDLEYVC